MSSQAVFAVVMYVYLGHTVASPAFSSLPVKWQKASYGLALVNFLLAGSLYAHTAAKLFFIRFFRKSIHLHEHTFVGWATWCVLVLIMNGAAFVLAVAVPVGLVSSPVSIPRLTRLQIFSYLIGIAASLFASWYTYGVAGFFWL
jgi:hypothetical protein